jgi:HSP20 family molecular chaperone IbpA
MSARKDAPQQPPATEELYSRVVATARQYVVWRHASAWHPPTDVIEDDEGLHVIVEIAGMQQGEFQVTLNQSVLTITGIRPAPSRAHSAYHQLEVRRGEFRADVMIPWPVDEDHIAARYHDGFLYVSLPRATSQHIRVVEVEKSEE